MQRSLSGLLLFSALSLALCAAEPSFHSMESHFVDVQFLETQGQATNDYVASFLFEGVATGYTMVLDTIELVEIDHKYVSAGPVAIFFYFILQSVDHALCSESRLESYLTLRICNTIATSRFSSFHLWNSPTQA